MAEQWVYVGLFVLAFASLPFVLKKFLQTKTGAQFSQMNANKIVSVVNLGPSQRVVTVEVGPEDGRVMLVLGVSGQSIACLHKFETNPVGGSLVPKATNFGVDSRKEA